MDLQPGPCGTLVNVWQVRMTDCWGLQILLQPTQSTSNNPKQPRAECTVTVNRKHLYHWIQDDTVATRSKTAGATLVWPWCSPETDESARTYQERPPARASESARLGNVIPLPAADSGHWLHRSSHSCLALSAQKPPNPQVSFTLTENKVDGEAACTGDSESQHRGPTGSKPWSRVRSKE